jgi:capsular exopolysaccharide synthesis family protein
MNRWRNRFVRPDAEPQLPQSTRSAPSSDDFDVPTPLSRQGQAEHLSSHHSRRARHDEEAPPVARSGWLGSPGRGLPPIDHSRGNDGFDLVSILRILRRRAWVLILCTLLVGGGIYAYSSRQPKSYVASAKLHFGDPGFDQAIVAPNARTQSVDPERDAATNLQDVEVRPIAERTAQAIGGGLTGDSVASQIHVTADGKSNFVSIQATAADPDLAARLATMYARQYISSRRSKAIAQIRAAQAVVRRRLATLSRTTNAARKLPQPRLSQEQATALDEERTLRDQDNQLSVLASLQNGGAELAEAAVPPSAATSPRPMRDAVLGGLLGLLLGLSLAFMFERFDRHVKEPDQLKGDFHQPTLGRVPESRALRKPTKYIGDRLPPLEAEAFRLLWANLRFYNAGRDIRSVLVTSAVPREGKTTVALHVGATAASTGARTLLIEADLRGPSLGRMLALPAGQGLIEVIHGELSLEEAAQRVELAYVDGIAPFDVLLSGGPFRNPAILLESPAFHDLLDQAEHDYDLVVIDTPSTAFVSDAIALLTQVSGVLVVTRLGHSTRMATSQLANQLANVDAPVLGLAVNSVSSRSLADDYDGVVARPPLRAQ